MARRTDERTTRGSDTCFRLCERLYATPEVVQARVTVLPGPAEGGRQVLVSGTPPPWRRAIPTQKRTAVIIGITAGKPVVFEHHGHDPDPVAWAIPVRPDSTVVILQVAEQLVSQRQVGQLDLETNVSCDLLGGPAIGWKRPHPACCD